MPTSTHGPEIGHTKFTVGRLFCSSVRGYLLSEITKGRDLKFYESDGLLERQFTVTGNLTDVQDVNAVLTAWAKKLELEEAAAQQALADKRRESKAKFKRCIWFLISAAAAVIAATILLF